MITLEDGRSAVLFNAAASNVVMTYNYTPLVSKQLLFRDVIKSQKLSKFRFINTNEEGKRLIIEFPKGYSSGDSIELPFQADETTDDAANFPITIKAFPTKDQELCRITDEQDIL
ncbi:MAG: hypothetical protein LBG52_01690 [Candidatus Peribacteria bacterium]|jgi:hypothetical protein|nr:hypothetical protein [Candidatus Peribacteria bacterium]